MSCCSWSATCWCWASRSASWLAITERRSSATRARSSLPWARAALAWRLELVALLLQLVGLQLDPLAGRGDVGDGAADLGQVLELLVVGEVERLPRVLEPVQRLVPLGLEDRAQTLPKAHGASLRRKPTPGDPHRGSDRPDGAIGSDAKEREVDRPGALGEHEGDGGREDAEQHQRARRGAARLTRRRRGAPRDVAELGPREVRTPAASSVAASVPNESSPSRSADALVGVGRERAELVGVDGGPHDELGDAVGELGGEPVAVSENTDGATCATASGCDDAVLVGEVVQREAEPARRGARSGSRSGSRCSAASSTSTSNSAGCAEQRVVVHGRGGVGSIAEEHGALELGAALASHLVGVGVVVQVRDGRREAAVAPEERRGEGDGPPPVARERGGEREVRRRRRDPAPRAAASRAHGAGTSRPAEVAASARSASRTPSVDAWQRPKSSAVTSSARAVAPEPQPLGELGHARPRAPASWRAGLLGQLRRGARSSAR